MIQQCQKTLENASKYFKEYEAGKITLAQLEDKIELVYQTIMDEISLRKEQ